MAYVYDTTNIFARILRGEIPCQKVLETEHTLAFEDISPAAPHHVLVIPKGPYVTADHFAQAATDAEIVDYWRVIGRIAADLGLQPGEGGQGFRLITNVGDHGHQEVPHLHFHLLGGRPLGRMLAKVD